ncbi:MAG TPA: MmgE/PrpD family protein [Ktedonobacteraceae bacterium]|nr:MmgE/PrpD family protein [Ktedonobacteraceae bacterium]
MESQTHETTPKLNQSEGSTMPSNPMTNSQQPIDMLATRLAAWVARLRYDDIPDPAVHAAKLLLLDQLGLQINGTTLSSIQPGLRLVEEMRAAPESTVVRVGTRTTAAYAAFANGMLAGSSEFDDVHLYAGHIGSHVVPAALAVAELTGASGREVLAAVVAGAQVMSVLGGILTVQMEARGWHRSKILGTFGSAAAAGKLLGLTVQQLAHAFGISGSDASGGMEYEFSGGEVKRMHSGSAARLGVQAALLARNGLTGPLTIIEGERGLVRLFAGQEVDAAAVDRVWDRFHVVDTVFRMYPTIGSAATVLEGMSHLIAEDTVDWKDIAEIRVGLPPVAIGHGARTIHPTDAVTAQFSTAFGIALMLVHGSNQPADYMNPAMWTDPDIATVIDKVVPYERDFGLGASLLSARIDVTLSDGRVLSCEQHGFRGDPNDPGRDEAVEAKFRRNVDGIVTPLVADSLITLSLELEHQNDIAGLVRLTVLPRSGRPDHQLPEGVLPTPRLNAPDPHSMPAEVARYLADLPSDPLFTMLSHAVTVIRPQLEVARAIYTSLQLPARVRELAILVLAHEAGSDFVWDQHVPISEAAGVSDKIRQLIRRGDYRHDTLSEHDSTILRLTASIVSGPSVPDELFSAARAILSEREVVELLLVIGYYWTISRMSTVLDLQATTLYAQDFGTQWPDKVR